MGKVENQAQLLEHIARLRRASRRVRGDVDIDAVRAALETELGASVSRRMAARFLGISHTALERWIHRGDVPVVPSLTGRMEVPVPALIDLREARDEIHDRRPFAAVMRRNREAAERLTVEVPSAAETHDGSSARGLAYHRAVAARLRREHVEEARYRLGRWRAGGPLDDRYADEWERILSGTLADVRRAMTAPGDHADDLRQNSPFAGMLSEPERRRILELAG